MQSVYRISGGAGLALTTAHYYTPSGRLIQRPWDDDLRRVSALHAARSGQPSGRTTPSELKHTDAGSSGLQRRRHRARQAHRRPVGPGNTGGFNVGRFARMLNARQAFASYAQKYTADGDARVGQQSTGRKHREAELRRRRRDGRRLPAAAGDRRREDRRSRVQAGSRVHQGDDSLRDRRRRCSASPTPGAT